MKAPFAIVFAGVLMAAALYFGLGHAPAYADRGGPYYMVAHQNNTINPGIFRIDSASGSISYCFVRGSSETDTIVHCTKPVE